MSDPTRTYLDFERPLAELEAKIEELENLAGTSGDDSPDTAEETARLRHKANEQLAALYSKLDPWRKTQVARHPERPHFRDYRKALIEDFEELCGDRRFSEDAAIVGGLGRFRGRSVVVIGHEKGHDTESRIKHNFGMARPEGYRKAIRLMDMAEKFDLPVLTFVDTAGAYPGLGAEERGQSEAIARSTERCLTLGTPLISTITGEGGSGGAVALASGNVVMMLEHSIYSVISPEGCASILWKDRAAAPDAANALKITSEHLKKFGLVDEIIPEPLGGAHNDPEATATTLKKHLLKHLKTLKRMPLKQRLDERYNKFRDHGQFEEEPLAKAAN